MGLEPQGSAVTFQGGVPGPRPPGPRSRGGGAGAWAGAQVPCGKTELEQKIHHNFIKHRPKIDQESLLEKSWEALCG